MRTGGESEAPVESDGKQWIITEDMRTKAVEIRVVRTMPGIRYSRWAVSGGRKRQGAARGRVRRCIAGIFLWRSAGRQETGGEALLVQAAVPGRRQLIEAVA